MSSHFEASLSAPYSPVRCKHRAGCKRSVPSEAATDGRRRPSTGGRDRWHVMVKIWRPTQDLARRVFAVVHAFVVFIHSLSSVHLFYKTTQNRPLTAMIWRSHHMALVFLARTARVVQRFSRITSGGAYRPYEGRMWPSIPSTAVCPVQTLSRTDPSRPDPQTDGTIGALASLAPPSPFLPPVGLPSFRRVLSRESLGLLGCTASRQTAPRSWCCLSLGLGWKFLGLF